MTVRRPPRAAASGAREAAPARRVRLMGEPLESPLAARLPAHARASCARPMMTGSKAARAIDRSKGARTAARRWRALVLCEPEALTCEQLTYEQLTCEHQTRAVQLEPAPAKPAARHPLRAQAEERRGSAVRRLPFPQPDDRSQRAGPSAREPAVRIRSAGQPDRRRQPPRSRMRPQATQARQVWQSSLESLPESLSVEQGSYLASLKKQAGKQAASLRFSPTVGKPGDSPCPQDRTESGRPEGLALLWRCCRRHQRCTTEQSGGARSAGGHIGGVP